MEDVGSAVKLKCNDKCNIDGPNGKSEAVAERARASSKLTKAVVFCLIFIFVEVAGGIIANSLAILTDAAHLFSDVAGFSIALFAIWASGWDANPRQTFGYYRLEILGALLSIQIIWLVTGVLVYEAIVRFMHPDLRINGKIMFAVACAGLGVNLSLMATLGHEGHGHSHGHGQGHDHSHSSTHNHKHEEEHKHEDTIHHGHKSHRHEKTKLSILSRVANLFRKKKRNHDHSSEEHGTRDRGHKSHKHGNKAHVIHGQDDEVHEIHMHDNEFDQKEVHGLEITHNGENEGHMHENMDRRKSVKVDADLLPYEKEKKGEKSKGNINVRGAYLHALGDLIQSIGVMIAGVVIWYRPSLYFVDPICTLVFSVLVLGTTYNMIRDIVCVLMESTPREIDASALETGLLGLSGVVAVHELHIWAITVGRSLLACHILAEPLADTNEVLQKVTDYCEKVYKISHVTIQVERDV